jgi:ubiquinol-cytochrome c reductase cytochrome c subunit
MITLAGLVLVATLAHAQTAAPPQGAATSPAAAPQAAPAGNAEAGRKMFVSYGCWQCHGYEGQGGAAGPRLSGRPLPYAGFARYVRRPTNQMPPYTEKVLPDADLASMHAFLASRPAPPAAQSIPLLK